jgi:hypothetical protein
MSKAIPSKPPRRPFTPAYAVTTTTRVPGMTGGATRPEPSRDLDGGQTAAEA